MGCEVSLVDATDATSLNLQALLKTASARTRVGAISDIQPTIECSLALVDRVEYLHRMLERDGGDADFGAERVVETVDDE